MVERLFLAVPRGCLQFVIVVFPDHTHLLFLNKHNANLKVRINYYVTHVLGFTFIDKFSLEPYSPVLFPTIPLVKLENKSGHS